MLSEPGQGAVVLSARVIEKHGEGGHEPPGGQRVRQSGQGGSVQQPQDTGTRSGGVVRDARWSPHGGREGCSGGWPLAGLQPLQVCLQTRLVRGRWRSGGRGIRPGWRGQSTPRRDGCDTRLASAASTPFWSLGWELSIPQHSWLSPISLTGGPFLTISLTGRPRSSWGQPPNDFN